MFKAKKAAKAAERPPPVQSTAKSKIADEEDLPPHKYFEYRSKKVNELRTSKIPDPYPHKFHTSMAIPEFIEKFSHVKRGEQLKNVQVALAGRVMVIRDNNKLKFYDLHGEVPAIFTILIPGI